MYLTPTIEDTIRTFGHGLTNAHVRLIRATFGLSSDAFAELLGVTPGTVWRWENYEHDTPGSMPSKLMWLALLSAGAQAASPPMDLWSLLELSAKNDPRLQGASPRTKRPVIWRNTRYLKTSEYAATLSYRPRATITELSHCRKVLDQMSQRQMSYLLGVTQVTLSLWFNGRSHPSAPASKLIYLLSAAPLLYEEQVPIYTVLDWMRKGVPTQPWQHLYQDQPLQHPFRYPTNPRA